MCGITAGVSNSDITGTLLEGLVRLEYRGYDSAGLALLNENGEIKPFHWNVEFPDIFSIILTNKA